MNTTIVSEMFRLTITGDFDKKAVRRMSARLAKFGSVKKNFFFPKSKTLKAGVQFSVTTVHNVADLKTVLEQISGVTKVHVEANHA